MQLDYSKKHIGLNNRATFATEAVITGRGVHTAEQVRLRLIPAPAQTGVVFRSTDSDVTPILVSPFSVVDTCHAVSLGNEEWRVATVEHLLAALHIAGITDGIIEVSGGSELPIMDGSAYPFYEAIVEGAGVMDLGQPLEPIVVTAPLWEIQGDRYVIALPSDNLRISSGISYEHPQLKGGFLALDMDSETCINELLAARTFGFLNEVEALKAQGLARGASVENAVVLTEDGYLNDSLRFPDECVRHKVLDIIGDLYLMGRPLQAHIIASRTGHSLNVALGRRILEALTGNELTSRRNTSDELPSTGDLTGH